MRKIIHSFNDNCDKIKIRKRFHKERVIIMLKKLFHIMLSVFMICASLHLGVLQTSAQESTNLALNQRVFASSTASGKVIGNVVDGQAVSKATWQNN